jgi:hypothetical protein
MAFVNPSNTYSSDISRYNASAAFPTHTFSLNGAGNFIFTSGDGTVATTEKMRIDTSGNVGIGTTAPSDKLTVISAGTQVGSTNFRNIARIGLATNDASVLLGYDVSAGSAIMASTNNFPIAFWTSSAGTYAEKMRIDSSGNVGIGTSSPNASAILDAQSTTKGVRMPNMTTTQKNAISSPAAGLMVFDTTLAKLCVYSGSAWQTITSV